MPLSTTSLLATVQMSITKKSLADISKYGVTFTTDKTVTAVHEIRLLGNLISQADVRPGPSK